MVCIESFDTSIKQPPHRVYVNVSPSNDRPRVGDAIAFGPRIVRVKHELMGFRDPRSARSRSFCPYAVSTVSVPSPSTSSGAARLSANEGTFVIVIRSALPSRQNAA